MTGIERLRAVCAGLALAGRGTEVATINGEPAAELLSSIADQIEREAAHGKRAGGEPSNAYYDVPGFGDLMPILDAIGNRDAGVERPSQWAKRFSALSYVVRAPWKGGAEDVRKAIDYLERLAEEMEAGR